MNLLTVVEYIISDPAHRLALYRRCSPEDRSVRSSGMGQDESRLLKIASSFATDLALLERRATSEGFRSRWPRLETVRKAAWPLLTGNKWAQTVDRRSKLLLFRHGLDAHPEMPIPSRRAEVCTKAAILY
jgi:hypothetical protein